MGATRRHPGETGEQRMTSRRSTQRSIEGAESGLVPARAASRYAEVNGLRLHYLDYGTEGAQPMLCVHGGAAHGHWFDFVAAGFTPDHHVLALDLRGHGDSEWADPPVYTFQTYADDIEAFAEKLDLRDFILVGHSMGGMVALNHAALHPGRAAKLVVVDTRTLMSADRIAKMREFGAKPASSYASEDELVARYRLEPAGTQKAAPEVIRHMARNSGRQRPDGRWQHKFDRSVYAMFERADGLPLWARVKIPALLVKGSSSKRIDAKMVEEVRARAPQIEVVEVADADHHVTLDNPRGFVEAVRGFLAK
jgi:pimeloyl-ACP methyl ester carboxylesterase